MSTINTMSIKLTCNNRELVMGPGEEIDIVKVTGLESSEVTRETADNAMLDGQTMTGKKIASRPVHIEAKYRYANDNAAKRMECIRFFNPKFTGDIEVTVMGTTRHASYELEGWAFNEIKGMDNNLSFVADLTLDDPYWYGMDDFGKNLAQTNGLTVFPWRVTAAKVTGLAEQYRGLALGGMTMSYKLLGTETIIENDGDVECGFKAVFTARNEVQNPKIENITTGTFMQVYTTLAQGDELVISTTDRKQSITLNGVNIYQRINRQSSPILLAVGGNLIRYSADVGQTNMDINLYYTPRYLGV